MKKVIIAILILLSAGNIYSADIVGFTGYGSGIYYLGTENKTGGFSASNYISVTDYINTFEFAAGFTEIFLRSFESNLSNTRRINNYKIWDFTESYTNSGGLIKNVYVKLGFHYTSSEDDEFADKGKTFIGDLSYFKSYRFSIGTEGALSFYVNPNTPMSVYQLKPHLMIRFFSNNYGALYSTMSALAIIVPDYLLLGLPQSNYYYGNFALNYYYKKFNATITVGKGEKTLSVENGGFLVYSLPEIYKSNYSLNLSYFNYLGLNTGILFSYSTFMELGNLSESSSLAATLHLGYNF